MNPVENQPYFRALYELSGLTQQELAEMFNVSLRSVERWCTNTPCTDGVIDEMEAYEKDIADFVRRIVDKITILEIERGAPCSVTIYVPESEEAYISSGAYEKWQTSYRTYFETIKRLYIILVHNKYPVEWRLGSDRMVTAAYEVETYCFEQVDIC